MRRKRNMIALIALFTLIGCSNIHENKVIPKTIVPVVAKLGGSQWTRGLNNLENEYAAVKKKYEASVEQYRADIARSRKETDEHLEAGRFAEALDSLAELYKYTHPCGEESCNTYPCEGKECDAFYRREQGMPEINKYEAYMEREDIGDEREFILEAVERAYALTDKLQQERRFDELDVALARHASSIPGPPENKAKFAARHKKLKQAWIDTLVADAGKLGADKPGASALLYGKAAKLAGENGDGALAKELNAKARAAARAVIDEHRYTIALGTIKGPHASGFASSMERRKFDGAVKVGAGTHATLSIATSSPVYRESKGETEGSFRYKSGTEEVPNPDRASKERDCEAKKFNYENSTEMCNRNPESSQCGAIERQTQEWRDCTQELGQLPATVSKDVYSTQTYPITLHHLDASMGINAKLTHADGRSALSFSGAKARVTDRSHAAHSKGDAGVEADPAEPPSERSGFSALEANVKQQLVGIIMKSFEAYRAGLLEGKSSGDDAELDILAVHVLLRPSTVGSSVRDRLERVAKMSDGVEVLEGLTR